MTNNPVRHRPNVLFNLIGVLLIVGGIGLLIYGFAYALQIMSGFDPLRGDGPPVRIADGMALAFWGVIVSPSGDTSGAAPANAASPIASAAC